MELYLPIGGGVLGLIVLILDIIAVVEVLQSSRAALEKLLWILVIIFFPLLGLIIYCVVTRCIIHRHYRSILGGETVTV